MSVKINCLILKSSLYTEYAFFQDKRLQVSDHFILFRMIFFWEREMISKRFYPKETFLKQLFFLVLKLKNQQKFFFVTFVSIRNFYFFWIDFFCGLNGYCLDKIDFKKIPDIKFGRQNWLLVNIWSEKKRLQ